MVSVNEAELEAEIVELAELRHRKGIEDSRRRLWRAEESGGLWYTNWLLWSTWPKLRLKLAELIGTKIDSAEGEGVIDELTAVFELEVSTGCGIRDEFAVTVNSNATRIDARILLAIASFRSKLGMMPR